MNVEEIAATSNTTDATNTDVVNDKPQELGTAAAAAAAASEDIPQAQLEELAEEAVKKIRGDLNDDNDDDKNDDKDHNDGQPPRKKLKAVDDVVNKGCDQHNITSPEQDKQQSGIAELSAEVVAEALNDNENDNGNANENEKSNSDDNKKEDIEDDPMVDHIEQDSDENEFIVYKPVQQIPPILIPIEEFERLIQVDPKGTSWKTIGPEYGKKSEAFRTWVKPILPNHITLSFNKPFAVRFVDKNTGGRRKREPFCCGFDGFCSAKLDGCETTFIVGFKDEHVRQLAPAAPALHSNVDSMNVKPTTIPLFLVFEGTCRHLKGRDYDQLRGGARKTSATNNVDTGTTKSSKKNIAKKKTKTPLESDDDTLQNIIDQSNELVQDLLGTTDDSLESSIPPTYITGLSNLIALNKKARVMLLNQELPYQGWSDQEIQNFLSNLSILHSNTATADEHWIGESTKGRLCSGMVTRRHYGFSSGINHGKPTNLSSLGSTVLRKLTIMLTMDVIRRGCGLGAKTAAKNGIVLPLTVPMSLSIVLNCLRKQYRERNIVMWCRNDDDPCFQAILAMPGILCVIVPSRRDEDNVVTDLPAIENTVNQYQGRVLAVVTTTACHAPRVMDAIEDVAALCQRCDIGHIINNSYGIQCTGTTKIINRACVTGRVDAVICSTEENFFVPAGSSVIVSPSEQLIKNVDKAYVGDTPPTIFVDLFITLLSMGMKKIQTLMEDRSLVAAKFRDALLSLAVRWNERLLQCPNNTISYAITLDQLVGTSREKDIEKVVENLQNILTNHCLSGIRLVPKNLKKTMGGPEVLGYGSSCSNYPYMFLSTTCMLGVTLEEVKEVVARLDIVFQEYKQNL